jgi:serine/threonine protein kinase
MKAFKEESFRYAEDELNQVKVIGRGAFGEVRLCRSRADPDQLYAIKVALEDLKVFKFGRPILLICY